MLLAWCVGAGSGGTWIVQNEGVAKAVLLDADGMSKSVAHGDPVASDQVIVIMHLLLIFLSFDLDFMQHW